MTDQLLGDDTDIAGGDAAVEFDAAPAPRAERVPLSPAPWWRRAAGRVVRRPRDWMGAPWPRDRLMRVCIGLLLVGGSTFAALRTVHPDLIFDTNTPTGGDMGAHVMGPAYLRDVLLPNFQLSGWSNYWYAGFPMYRFYMVVPALMIVLINVVLPYGVAFKIVVVLGIVSLPLCCWAFGRLASFRYPMPELFGLAGLLFLFDESFSIYGGNVKSTMAGEFSFSIALSFGILGLGLFARGLESGKYRCWAAVALALAILSHGIVAIFVVLGMVLLWLVWMDKKRWLYGVTTGLTVVLLSAFWILPFLSNHAYMTDMKYGYRPQGAEDSFWDMFFPLTTFFDIFITTFAVIGFVTSIVKRHLNGAWLGICTLALVAGVYITRDSLPIIGLLWNPRLLPFVYLLRYLLMMVGIVETVHLVVRVMRNEREIAGERAAFVGTAIAVAVGFSVLVIELMFFRIMPGADFQTHNGKAVYQWGPVALSATSTDALSDAWSRYNFTGYEEKGAYGEYKALVDTMAGLGADPAEGCGRALWENNQENGKYGTTMALMLLPHWTDGCIASMEGLFFEASGTTPYHFLTAAAMSESSSNPVRELRYDNTNAALGVPYLQTLGVKYVMVFTEAAKNQASLQPELRLVRQTGPWNIYAVAGSDLVVPLATQPVIVNLRSGDPRERNLELGTSWFQHRDEWIAMPADDGPSTWQRIDVAVDLSRRQDDKVDIVQPTEPINEVDLPAVTVSNIDLGDQDLSFDVDTIGVPVLVKVSYFPNWDATGADGPYRIAPNLMVVVPTSTHVDLEYGRSGLDVLSYVLTLLGFGLLVFWRFSRGDEMYGEATTTGSVDDGNEPWSDRFAGSPDDGSDSATGGASPGGDPSIWEPERTVASTPVDLLEHDLEHDLEPDLEPGDPDMDPEVARTVDEQVDAASEPGAASVDDTPATGVDPPEGGPEWPRSPDSL